MGLLQSVEDSYELHAIMNYYNYYISRNDLLPVCFAVFSENEKGNEMPPKCGMLLCPPHLRQRSKYVPF